MFIKHLKTLISGDGELNRIASSCWSPNNLKLAIATADNIVTVYDENGEKKDKFQTKPADATTKKHYIVTMRFSPDSSKLAIAQSDSSIFIYKLGIEWGEKKSICNKFIQACEILCMCWPKSQVNGVVFGLADGKVRVGNLKSNKAATLYHTESPTISIACNHKGTAVVSGHLDNSVYHYFFEEDATGGSQGKVCTHSSTPYLLAWGETIIVLGTDYAIASYTPHGRMLQKIKGSDESRYSTIEMSSNGQTAIIGGFNRLRVLQYKTGFKKWEESLSKALENTYTATSLSWKPDGSRLIIGSSTGFVEMFDSCISRTNYKGKFELTYTSNSQVIVYRISNGSRIVLNSQSGDSITKVDIFKDQFLVAHTDNTIILADMSTYKLSEIPWKKGGNEKFYFEIENLCMIFSVGELCIVEYGVNKIIGTCRTEYSNPHSISIRLDETSKHTTKVVAYLTDAQSIQVDNLVTGFSIAEISHDFRIDWLELSTGADKILFRDRRLQVYIYDFGTQKRSLLINYCSYIQWVPMSDVIVAQNRNDLLVWYFVDSLEKVVIIPITGDVESIERNSEKTSVYVREGADLIEYPLDALLIEFGSSFDVKDYARAIHLLESLEWSEQVETMWKKLAVLALEDGNIIVAERCYAEMGDISSARYLRSTYKSMERIIAPDSSFYSVKAKIAILAGRYKEAETIYLQHGQIDEALSMYQDVHKWDSAIKVAESKNHPDLLQIKDTYYSWLSSTGQEDVLGQIKEIEAGGIPGKAAQIILKNNMKNEGKLVESTASSLLNSQLFEMAGDLFCLIDNIPKALDCYKQGSCFKKAIGICRVQFPESILDLEDKWGDYLLNQSKVEQAVNHFIEAGKVMKALNAAISGKFYSKAASIVDNLSSPKQACELIIEMANHFANANDFEQAEKYYLLCEKPRNAIEMYMNAGQWSYAFKLSSRVLTDMESESMFQSKAKFLETQGNYKDAETIYIMISSPNSAISMYRDVGRYKEMLALVKNHHPEALNESYLYLAKLLESQGNLSQAEVYFLAASDWKSAVQMHCVHSNYEAAFKVAKANGGVIPASHVAYIWAKSLTSDAAIKTLVRLGMLDEVIEIATENGLFDFAYTISATSDQKKKVEVILKHAMHLEDSGNFDLAETMYIKAGKPREAILMHIHNERWDLALAVANKYDPEYVSEVLYTEARNYFEKKDFPKMEIILLRSPRPDLAISFYKEIGMLQEALAFAEKHLSSKVSEIRAEILSSMPSSPIKNIHHILSSARKLELDRNYENAIRIYLGAKPNSNEIDDAVDGWMKAVELSEKFFPASVAQKTILESAQKMYHYKKYEQAGELFSRLGLKKEAVDSLLKGNLWEKAKLACGHDLELRKIVESSHTQFLSSEGDFQNALQICTAADIESLYRQGEWIECLTAAKSNGGALFATYSERCMNEYLTQEDWDGCWQLVKKFGTVDPTMCGNSYLNVFNKCLNANDEHAMVCCRQIMSKMIEFSPQFIDKHSKHFEIIHLLALQWQFEEFPEFAEIQAKISVALLRHVDIYNIDKAFYCAGNYARAVGKNNVAFGLWNIFLDICDAIEENNVEDLNTSALVGLNLVQDVKFPLSTISDAKREDARDWILQKSLEKNIKPNLEYYDCVKCSTKLFQGATHCHHCDYDHPFCSVTGYPIIGEHSACKNCKMPANTDSWIQFVSRFQSCPWCKAPQALNYK